MALAEARAAWQRSANRCLVQEDAKRLACCSSVPPSSKHDQMVPPNLQDIPISRSLPFTQTPSHSNMSPNSRWWLQMQPNYEFQKGLMEESYSGLIDHTSPVDNLITSGMKDVKDDSHDALKLGFEEDFKELRDEGFVSIQVSKNTNDVYFDSESSSWVGVERNTPWWRTADTEELALIVAQRSLDLIENCDLPMPRKNCLSHDVMSTTSLPVRKTCIRSHHHSYTHNSAPPSLSGGSYCQKPRIVVENQLLSGPDKSLSPIEKRKPEMNTCDEEGSKAQLLEALRHSQTRAREAEKVAKEACAEKEDVVKLVFRQASQLFAYKQWLQLLQLENMYFQFKNKQTPSPWTTPTSRKLKKTSSRKWGKRSRCEYDVGSYAIVFALGLGLVGAGLFLGWTIGWMLLPTW